MTLLRDVLGRTLLERQCAWRKLMPVLPEFDPDVALVVGLYSPL